MSLGSGPIASYRSEGMIRVIFCFHYMCEIFLKHQKSSFPLQRKFKTQKVGDRNRVNTPVKQ